MSRGWMKGTKDAKKAVSEDLKDEPSQRVVESEASEMREPRWERGLQEALRILGRDREMLGACRKSSCVWVRHPMCRVWSVARGEGKCHKSGEYLKYMENWTPDPFLGLSSYPKYWKRNPPTGLRRDVLASLCGFADSASGMRGYRNHLMLCEEGDPGKCADLMRRYCRGWFTGSAKARKDLAKDLAGEAPMVEWEGVDMRELNEARWEAVVADEMEKSGKSEAEIVGDRKSAPWKVAIAKRLRRETTAGNPWIAKRLRMGSPNYVSNLIHA